MHKTNNACSSIAIYHADEQCNALVKGEGGALGLTDNPSDLKRWMAAGPELSAMVQEFEIGSSSTGSTNHHEQAPAVQATLASKVSSLVRTIDQMGNPFTEDSGDLLTLDTMDILEPEAVSTVRNALKLGQAAYSQFITERFIDCSKSINDPIHYFLPPKNPSKQTTQVAVLKDNCTLFSRLYIACQSREGNPEEFFNNENQPYPPSLAKNGEMRSGNKADLLHQLENLAQSSDSTPQTTAAVLDGDMIVQMLSPGASKTFSDYSNTVFMPYI